RETGRAGGGERAARRGALRGRRGRQPATHGLPAGGAARRGERGDPAQRGAGGLPARGRPGHGGPVVAAARRPAVHRLRRRGQAPDPVDGRQAPAPDRRRAGPDWGVAEVRRVTSALLGGFLDVPAPAGLEADFLAMTRAAMSKEVADVALRVWTPRQARLRFVKQMVPAVEDLTGRRVESGT